MIIPARMAASRLRKAFKTHKWNAYVDACLLKNKLYKSWDKLSIAGCDKEILNFVKRKTLSMCQLQEDIKMS